MTKKQIRSIVVASYTDKGLDEEIVKKISFLLSRKDVKAYIREIKLVEKKRNIYIALPSENVYNIHKDLLQNLFVDKKLVFEEDSSLLLGVRIIDNDMVYEQNLKQKLESILECVD